MRPTDPLPPRSDRETDVLVEELCLALRDVGVSTQFLPYFGPLPDIEKEVQRVQEIAAEPRRREVAVDERLRALSTETKWSMSELYAESIAFPAKRPWVRSTTDGLRIALRCGGCTSAEFPESSRRLRLCDACIDDFHGAISARRTRPQLLLYRTYAPEPRCEHADDETVLGVHPWSTEWSEDFPVGFCRECLSNERVRRRPG